MDWPIECPCEHKDAVLVKKMFGDEYGLFSICDLEPTIDILQEVLKAQGKPLIEFVG